MTGNPIFIHSLFRTGSTYIWNKFRQNKNYYCYYEPFHPSMIKINRNSIKNALTLDYKSVHHPRIEKYYLMEYKNFLKGGKIGVPFFKKSFAFDEFCNLDENPDLKHYIDFLIQGAGSKIALCQFNRTAFRVKWFQQYYPNSFNIYLIRSPRDQWQSYVELYKRTRYIPFFALDLLIVSKNLDRDSFLSISKHLPFFEFNADNLDWEIIFYKTIVDSYSMEEQYFVFYYLWFKAFVENVLHSDLCININLLCQDSLYKRKIIDCFLAKGWPGINFQDSQITTYSDYTLTHGVMETIEDNVQKIVLHTIPVQTIKMLFKKMSKDDSNYFKFYQNEWENKKRQNVKPPNILEKTVDKFRVMVGMFSDKYFQQLNKISQINLILLKKNRYSEKLEKQILEKEKVIKRIRDDLNKTEKQLENMNETVKRILNSYTYKTGKILVFPFLFIKRLLGKK
jgi:hypothetical protein